MAASDGRPGGIRPGDQIYREVTSWPGVTTGTGDFGEVEYFVRGRMIGHVHGDELADIPFPRSLRDRLVAEGRTGPHHIHPDSGWTSRLIHGPADADEVIQLLRINYDRVTRAAASASD
jgi:hypothetical protein